MKAIWHHAAVQWQPGNASYERIALSVGCQFDSPGKRANFSVITHMSNKGLALALWFHIPATTARLCWAGTILYWADYSWYWRKEIMLYGGDMCTFPRALPGAVLRLKSISHGRHMGCVLKGLRRKQTELWRYCAVFTLLFATLATSTTVSL